MNHSAFLISTLMTHFFMYRGHLRDILPMKKAKNVTEVTQVTTELP